jgi:division protein CdvB (Snf7/Vps24/ESCRT-III family)
VNPQILNTTFVSVTLPLLLGMFLTAWAAITTQNKRFEDFKESVNQRFNEVNRRFDEMNRKFDEIIKRLDSIDEILKDHERRLTRVEERVALIRS